MNQTITIKLQTGTRRCGDCTLCCKLIPVPEIKKPSNVKCPHQHQHPGGCLIYDRRPMSCRLWSCRWLTNDDTDDLKRPDRVGYVIDPAPDFVTRQNTETGESINIPVVQVWIDHRRPNAFLEKGLLRFIQRRSLEGMATLIRRGSQSTVTIFPPTMNPTGKWLLLEGGQTVPGHSFLEVVNVLAKGEAK